MRYLRSCESDVFISYSHFDNEVDVRDREAGSRSFIRPSKCRLKQLLGEELVVWRDPKLTGNEYFEETLRAEAPEDGAAALGRFTALRQIGIVPEGGRGILPWRRTVGRLAIPGQGPPSQGREDEGGPRANAATVAASPRLRILCMDQADRRGSIACRRPPGDESYQACLQKLEDLAYDIKDDAGGIARPRDAERRERTRTPRASFTSPTPSPICARRATSSGVNCASGATLSFRVKRPRRTAPGTGTLSPANCSRQACPCTCWASSTA